MEYAKRNAWGWAKRPQVWALFFACTVALFGLWPVTPPVGVLRANGATNQHEDLPVDGSVRPVVRTRPANCVAMPCLALTFDDGPDKDFTTIILDTLARHKVRATFFVMGFRAERRPDLIQREYREGHEIGNHSWDHADFTKLNQTQIRDQISHTQRVVTNANVPAPTLFRPPYGAVNDLVLANVPLTIVRWNIDPEDWSVKHPSNIIEHTMAHVKPGGVIILHDTEQYTAEALEALLLQLEGHYQFVTVSELFNLPPGQRGIYFGR